MSAYAANKASTERSESDHRTDSVGNPVRRPLPEHAHPTGGTRDSTCGFARPGTGSVDPPRTRGLIRTDGWPGAVVAPLNAALIRNLYQFREPVERYVAEVVARRIGVDWTPAE